MTGKPLFLQYKMMTKFGSKLAPLTILKPLKKVVGLLSFPLECGQLSSNIYQVRLRRKVMDCGRDLARTYSDKI